MADPTGELRPGSTTESESAVRSPQSADKITGTDDQQIPAVETAESPQSAVAESHGESRLLLGLICCPEIWDVRRPSVADLASYAKTGPYTTRPWPSKPRKERTAKDRCGLVRGLGVSYCYGIAIPAHLLLYSGLRVLSLPVRPLSGLHRRTLAEIHRHVAGSPWWGKRYAKALLLLHSLAYITSWFIERPSRFAYALGACGSFYFGVIRSR